MALKLYAQDELVATTIKAQHASAALFDTHPLAVNTAHFPTPVLHVPFPYILSKLKSPGKQTHDEEDTIEPTLQLSYILKAMEPPRCFGEEPDEKGSHNGTCERTSNKDKKDVLSLMSSPDSKALLIRMDSSLIPNGDDLTARSLLSEYLAKELEKLAETDLPSASLLLDLEKLLARAKRIIHNISGERQVEIVTRNLRLKSLLQECLRMKVRWHAGRDIAANDQD